MKASSRSSLLVVMLCAGAALTLRCGGSSATSSNMAGAGQAGASLAGAGGRAGSSQGSDAGRSGSGLGGGSGEGGGEAAGAGGQCSGVPCETVPSCTQTQPSACPAEFPTCTGGRCCTLFGACYECNQNGDCPDSAPFCDGQLEYVCSECRTDDDCPASEPTCQLVSVDSEKFVCSS